MFNASRGIGSEVSEREKRTSTANTPAHSTQRPTSTPAPGPTDATSAHTPERVCSDAPAMALKDFGASGGCVCDE